jgi:hypothetical protein
MHRCPRSTESREVCYPFTARLSRDVRERRHGRSHANRGGLHHALHAAHRAEPHVLRQHSGLIIPHRLLRPPDHVRFGERLDVSVLVEQIRAEQRLLRLLEQYASVPAVRQVRRATEAEPVLAGRERAPVFQSAGRPMKSLTFTIAPRSLQTTSARGATASHSCREPHSSDSKWLKLITRSREGSMSCETASRTSGNMPRSPVWKSRGSSSFTRK